MTRKEFIALYEKCQTGNCSPYEQQQLETYKDQFVLIDEQWQDVMGNKKAIEKRLLNNLHQHILIEKPKAYNRRYWYAAAASILILFTAGLMLWPNHNHSPIKNVSIAKTKIIVPGSDKATLTLANGTVINLDSSKKGLLVNENDVTVKKLNSGELTFNAYKGNEALAGDKNNMVATPRGGQYSIVLSDGTKVWLNSVSTLKFPTAFSGKNRDVELSGEAYFEVAKNKLKPFRVKINESIVEVLGTHFNVAAYQDESEIKTTLLEGSVKLSKGNQNAMLAPGEQGTFANQTDHIAVEHVNAEDAIAWKNGYFLFKDEDIKEVMKKVSRWYDVDILYKGAIGKKSFGGTVSRFDNISELLKTIELTGAIHFKVEERRVIVMP